MIQGYCKDQRSRASYDPLLYFYMNVLLPDLSMIMTEDQYVPSMGRYLPISSILFNGGIVDV